MFALPGELIDLAGKDKRLGICLDSCHLLASGYDVRTAEMLAAVMDECEKALGKRRLRCLHVNDSKTALGSNVDRHAALGEGELGKRGCGAFLSEPRFEKLPALFEGPGLEGKGIVKEIPGEVKACSYCPAFNACKQKDHYFVA